MLAVVIPVYNRADRLEKALHNLEGQIYKKFFTIVVDDASEEDIKTVCDKSSLNIKYVRQSENKGPGAARQVGLDLCIKNNIDFIMFMDNDDLYMPQAFQMLTYEITHGNYDMISSSITWEQNYKPNFTREPNDNTTWLGGKIYRVKSLIKHNISFNENLKTNEDLDFNLKVRFSEMKQAFIEDVLYFNCEDKRSITRCGDHQAKRCIGLDYIDAIYSVSKWLLENNLPLYKNMANIFACYSYYEFWKEKYHEIPQYIDDNLTEILSSEEFAKYLKNMYYWNRLKIDSYRVEDKIVYFFKETLYEWLKNHGYERS